MKEMRTLPSFMQVLSNDSLISRITRSVLPNGQVAQEHNEVEAEILRFYRGLLGSSSLAQGINPQIVRAGHAISSTDASDLLRPVTYEEINESHRSIHCSKAHGCNG